MISRAGAATSAALRGWSWSVKLSSTDLEGDVICQLKVVLCVRDGTRKQASKRTLETRDLLGEQGYGRPCKESWTDVVTHLGRQEELARPPATALCALPVPPCRATTTEAGRRFTWTNQIKIDPFLSIEQKRWTFVCSQNKYANPSFFFLGPACVNLLLWWQTSPKSLETRFISR
jgi:hypothetical protein